MKLDPEKPIFKTSDIADILGVTTNFVREQTCNKPRSQCDCGALHASVNKPGARRLRRYSLNDVLAYDRDAARRLERSAAS